jgi:hypothetical protein
VSAPVAWLSKCWIGACWPDNEFRNTTNNFLGYRVRFGKKQNDWDLDTFALQPLGTLEIPMGQNDEDTWFYGGVLSIRRWSEFITHPALLFGPQG